MGEMRATLDASGTNREIPPPGICSLSRLQDVFDFELSKDDVAAIDKLGERKLRMCNWKYRPGGGRIYEGETSAYPEK